MIRHITLVLVVALAAVVAGCGPHPATPIASNTPAATATATASATPAAGPPASFIPSAAQRQRFIAEGPEPTLRKLTALDYWLHYRLMQATGLEKALGGEAQAVSALRALGDAYEKNLRAAREDIPRLMQAEFTGEGIASGFIGMGVGSFVGIMTGGVLSAAVSGMSDAELAARSKAAPVKSEGRGMSHEMQFGQDGSLSQNIQFDVNDGKLNGKVKIRMRMDGCPDVNGRVSIDIEVDSQMTLKDKAGSGGFVHTEFKYERYLDDDAQLIETPDGGASDLHIRMGGYENFEQQSLDVSIGHRRGGEHFLDEHSAQGFGIFPSREDADKLKQLIDSAELMQTMMAEMMLRGMGLKNGAPWESGHCVDLKASSMPGQRSGLKPSTPFQLEAKPRLKSDGTMPGGTVTATLSGGSALQPATGKLKPDAKYSYVGPAEKEQVASIAFEARSKRGVGRATLDFDTKVAKPYFMKGGAQGIEFSGQICNLEATFFLKTEEVSIRFEPASAKDGRYSYSGKMSGFAVHGKGTYVVNYSGEAAVGITA
ncbi:MAG TPA: hypothetical protein VN645_14260, partial [Steroidobacteraceae bacterium]|nr:hypothetical protein [Steroidobacteraceae bacterium]